MAHGALYDQRVQAALATKGISTDTIYGMVLRLSQEMRISGDLLEFGAGTGNLVRLLQQSGYHGTITCADILPRPETLDHHIGWIQADLNEPLSLRDNAFDAVISTEVIEHLENPRATFREFYRLLRSRGTLVVTTPNQESITSYTGLLFGGHFVDFRDHSYPAHITAMLRKDFQRICREVGFEPPRFGYTDEGRLPKARHLHWQKLSLGLLKGRLFSGNVAVVTRKI